MATVAVQKIKVGKWTQERGPYDKHPDAEAFIVKGPDGEGESYTVWVKQSALDTVLKEYPGVKVTVDTTNFTGLINGHALLDPVVTIKTCGGAARPRILYRVVHDGQPGYGRVARSQAAINPLLHQKKVMLHLNQNCREDSPWMSTTTDRTRAVRHAVYFEARGCTGIKILKIRTSGPGWAHPDRHIFHVPDLIRAYKLPMFRRYYTEFLVQHSIPYEAVAGSIKWANLKATEDPHGLLLRKERQRMSPQHLDWIEQMEDAKASGFTYEEAKEQVGPPMRKPAKHRMDDDDNNAPTAAPLTTTKRLKRATWFTRVKNGSNE